MDVEMTVEDGIQAIVTSGVAMTSPDDDGLSREALASLTDTDLGDGTTENGTTANETAANGGASTARYDDRERFDPKHAETPADLARFRDGHHTRPRVDDEDEG